MSPGSNSLVSEAPWGSMTVVRTRPSGREGTKLLMLDTPEEGTDLAALAAGYISVTPLRLDRTDEAFSLALTETLK